MNADAEIPKKAEKYITIVIQLEPTCLNASAIAVFPGSSCSLAIPHIANAIKQYRNVELAIVSSIALGRSFYGCFASSARQVMKSNPRKAKNKSVAP